jgi:hypothetical protein
VCPKNSLVRSLRCRLRRKVQLAQAKTRELIQSLEVRVKTKIPVNTAIGTSRYGIFRV